MKTATLIGAFVCAGLPAVFGQGTLVLSNNSSGLVRTWASLSDPTHTTAALATFSVEHVQLVYAPAGTPASPFGSGESLSDWVARNTGWLLGPSAPLSTTELGTFNGGVVSLSGVGPGAQINYAVFGQTFHHENGTVIPDFDWVGLSDVFTSRIGVDVASAVPLAQSFTGVVLVPSNLVPEPSGALVGGVFGVLLARRRMITRLLR